MDNQDIDLLVQQLRTILLNKPLSKEPRVQSEELETLQDGIFYLADCLAEANDFLDQLRKGNLDTPSPGRHNFLAGSLKELHSALKHLTWQANQVANGDYSQSVDFLGDFSASFNRMIAQLAERESQLKIQSQIQGESVELMKAVMDGLKDWIMVISQESGEVVYSNQSAKQFFEHPTPDQNQCGNYHRFLEFIRHCGREHSENRDFEYHCCESRRTFRIRAYDIQWSGKMACAHIITDVTSEREYQEQIEGLAYTDALTDLYNRRFCLENLEKMLEEGKEFTFCMIDLDGLKYANDNFGHDAGDEYLKTVARHLLQDSRSTDLICRIGGDEFAALFPRCKAPVIVEKMERLDRVLEEESLRFPMSLSYGVVYVDGGERLSAAEVMKLADERMYMLKNMKKAARNSLGGVVMTWVWSKDLETGNEEIDREHRQLLSAVNRLLEACAAGRGQEELNRIVDFLVQYTQTHFAHEEQLQQRYGYPDYQSHHQYHQAFGKAAENLARRLKEEGGTAQLASRLNKQLVSWLINHIKMEDAKVARYIQKVSESSKSSSN